MSNTVIELNDSEVTVVQSGKTLARSPGVAVLGKDRIELGEAALQAAHIDPRNTFNRFWSNLNLDNFKHPSKQARHNADLAYAHLLAIHERAGQVDEMVFAVPGSFTDEQLSLLLGLGEAAPFTITGLVDSAVAATAASAGPGTYNHLDIHLHHTVVTALEVAATVNRTAVRVVSDAGLLSIHDKCADFIADQFIRQSRFDPLHHAESEQALYDRLPQCLQSLRQDAETLFEIHYRNTRYQARVNREPLLETLRPLYSKISEAADRSATCLASKRLADLPAFMEQLANAQLPAEILDEHAVVAGCMGYMQENGPEGGGIYFVTQLKAAHGQAVNPVTTPEMEVEEEVETLATHVLGHAEAHPLGPAPLYLSAGGDISMTKGPDSSCSITLAASAATLDLENPAAIVLVNGRPVTDRVRLRPGDMVGFAGSETRFTFITVLT